MVERVEFTQPTSEVPDQAAHDAKMQERYDSQGTPVTKEAPPAEPKDPDENKETPEVPNQEPSESDKKDQVEDKKDEPKEGEGGDAESDKDEDPQAPSAEDFAKYRKEFAEKGELTEDTYKELQEKYNLPKEVVDGHVAAIQAQQSALTQVAYSAAGGQEEFSKVRDWAQAKLGSDEKQAFNGALATNDPVKIAEAVSSLKARYIAFYGEEPKQRIDGAPSEGVGKFRSLAEQLAAQRDPRYRADPAFRDEVQKKILNSSY